ncbi:MAG: ABC transporter transmembrane domain-containing protein [Anaerolineales bacterium]
MFDRNLWKRAQQHIALLTATIVSGAVLGLLVISQSWFLSKVIAGVFIDGRTLESLSRTMIWLLAIILARAVVSFLREFLAGKLSIHFRSALSVDLTRHIFGLSPVQVGGERAGESCKGCGF